MTTYNYMRQATYNNGHVGQINLLLAYNGKLTDTMLAELAHNFEQELFARGLRVEYPAVFAWIKERMGFSKYNHPSRNAEIEINGDFIDYRAEDCGGGMEKRNTIFKAYA